MAKFRKTPPHERLSDEEVEWIMRKRTAALDKRDAVLAAKKAKKAVVVATDTESKAKRQRDRRKRTVTLP